MAGSIVGPNTLHGMNTPLRPSSNTLIPALVITIGLPDEMARVDAEFVVTKMGCLKVVLRR